MSIEKAIVVIGVIDFSDGFNDFELVSYESGPSFFLKGSAADDIFVNQVLILRSTEDPVPEDIGNKEVTYIEDQYYWERVV